MASILIIDDELGVRLSISQVLSLSGHQVVAARSINEGAAALAGSAFDLLITDVRLPDGNGIDLVRRVREDGFDGVIVVITAHGTIDQVVTAMKHGADDFLLKGFKIEELPLKADHWLSLHRVTKRLRLYERIEQATEAANPIIGESDAWKRALRLAARLASIPLQTPSEDEGITLPTILLTGETGVGKGVLARHIHACAIRDQKPIAGAVHAEPVAGVPPFVHVNCSALPPTLVEAELFGHERGAFTDARQSRAGLFEMADGGTIFLDEIADMPLELQSKLLLVVEQGRFRRVGEGKDRTVRVRVIAASNADLAERVVQGRFRRDLFYRLSAFVIDIPPLRERGPDALLIAEQLLARHARRYGREQLTLTDTARAAIAAYSWPGNVRELANALQRVAMLCDGASVAREDLALPDTRSTPTTAEGRADHGADASFVFDVASGRCKLDHIERLLIIQALSYTSGNISRAADLIGLTRACMRSRMKAHGISGNALEVTNR